MAFGDTLTLADHAAANKTFNRQSSLQNGVDYVESTATAGDQRKLSIRHTNAGTSVAKGAGAVRRHLFQTTHTRYNGTLGKQEKMVVNTTVTMDPGSSFTTADLQHLVAFEKSFFTDGNLDKLVRDEA